jgi:starvation-inducible DNA-binding protein
MGLPASPRLTKIGEYDLNAIDGVEHVQALSKQYAKVANAIRAAIKTSDDEDDATTADMFTQVSRQMDMDLWFLEAHLQAKR